jgi:hypothetical protein
MDMATFLRQTECVRFSGKSKKEGELIAKIDNKNDNKK